MDALIRIREGFGKQCVSQKMVPRQSSLQNTVISVNYFYQLFLISL